MMPNREAQRRTDLMHMVIVVACALLFCYPVIQQGFWPAFHDARYHSIWYTNFSSQFWAGEWYPRWLMDMNAGLGSPTFFYYPPVPFYITCLFHPLFDHDPAGWGQLGCSFALGLAVSGVVMRAWLKLLVPSSAALMGAIAYMMAPYHLATDLYMRGAFAEFWAFAWLPAVMYFTHRIHLRQRWGITGLAVSYALLIATHLPTTLVFSIVPLAYALVRSIGERSSASLVRTALGMAWGAGIAASYLVPAMTMQPHVSFVALTQGDNFRYDKNFLFSALNYDSDGFRSRLFWQSLTTLAMAYGGFLLAGRSQDGGFRRAGWFWLATALGCMFLMLPISTPVWELIPKLQVIQFPWRINSILILAACTLVGLGLPTLKRRMSFLDGFCVGGMALLGGAWIYFNAELLLPFNRVLPPSPETILERQNDAAEYTTRWRSTSLDTVIDALQATPVVPGTESTQSQTNPPLLPRLTTQRTMVAATLLEGQGNIQVLKWLPRKIELEVNTPIEGNLQISRFFYPGWQATAGGTPIPVSASFPRGLMQVMVPAGVNRITLEMHATTPEKAGTVISVLCLALGLVPPILGVYRKHAKKLPPTQSSA